MRLTIKAKLLGSTVGALIFLAGVSATGYWGITSVEKTTVEVAATGAAIRNHVEAGMFFDMTHDDISAVFAKKGQEQQDSLQNLSVHTKVFAQRIATARDAVINPALRVTLTDENKMVQDYSSAVDALAAAFARDPTAPRDATNSPINSTRKSETPASSCNKARNRTSCAANKQQSVLPAPCF